MISFSQGTAATFALLSSRPEFFDKINLFIAFAPIVYLTHYNPYKNYKIIGQFITPQIVRTIARLEAIFR